MITTRAKTENDRITMSSRDKRFYLFERRPAFLLSLLLSFVVIFGLACIVAYKSYTKAIDATIRSNETRATLLAKLILEHQRAAIGVLQSYADRPFLVDSVKRRDFEGTLKELTDLAENPEMDWPFVANPDSTVWVNYPIDRQAMNRDLSYRDWYKGVSKEWKPHISNVYKLIVGEKDLAVAVSAPILDEKGKVIGILSTGQSTAFFQKIIGETGSNLDAKISLVDQEGHIIYSNGFPYTKEIIGYPPFESVKRAMKGEKGNIKVRDASDRGRVKYVSFAPVEGIGWSIIVEKARNEVFRSETSYLTLIGIISLLLYGFSALSLVHLRGRHIQINELEKLNEELDDRVRERTAELEAGNKALGESEQRWVTTLASIGDAVIATDLSGKITFMNKVAEELTGWTLSEASTKPVRGVFNIISEHTRKEPENPVTKVLRGGTIVGLANHTVLIRKDGTEIPIDDSGAPIRDKDGKVIGVVLIFRDITQRKRAEEDLRKSENKYRIVADNTYDFEFWINPRGKFIYASPSGKVITGYNAEDFIKDPDLRRRIAHPDDRTILDGHIEDNEKKHKASRIEHRIIHADGSVRWISHACQPVFSDKGEYLGVRGSNRDITERKRAEETLRKERNFTSAVLDHTGGLVVVLDRRGRITRFNRACEAITGYTSEEVSGHVFWEFLVPPDELPGVKKTWDALNAGDFPNKHENHWVAKDGLRHLIAWSNTAIVSLQGDVEYIIGTGLDITERKQAEEALRESERRERERAEELAMLLEAAPTPVIIVHDPNGVHMTGNWAADELLRHPHGAEISLSAPPETRPRHFKAVKDGRDLRDHELPAQRAARGLQVRDFEFSLVFDDGTTRHVVGYGTPLRDQDGRPRGAVHVLVDITDRKRAEEALQQRTFELQHLTETLEQRVKERTAELAALSSQLVSAQENERKRVSYDLHDNVWQALVAIRFEIERLFSGKEGKDLVVLQRKSEKLQEAMMDAVGKIRSMQGDLWPYVLDDIGIVATIDWYCREFEKNHSGLAIERKNDLTENEISSSAKIVIYRILQETLSNVAKHSQARQVTIHLIKKDHRMEFIVQDNGIGFDPEEAIARKAPWGGLGLLSIKARTELSGGSFGVESIKGKGTTVRASWPL